MINVALAIQRREQLGLSQKELAIKMKVDVSDLSRWENGKRVPRVERLLTWETSLGLEPGALLRAEGGEPQAS